MGLRLASALWWFWLMRGYFQEGMHWLEHFIGLAVAVVPKRESARAFVRYGFVSSYVLNDEQLSLVAEEGLRRSRAVEDRQGTAVSLMLMAGNPYYATDVPKSRAFYEESLALFREAEDPWGTAWSALMLAQLLDVRLRDHATARCLVKEAMTISRKMGDVDGVASALFRLGEIERHSGNYDRARSYYDENLPIVLRLNDRFAQGIVFWSLGSIAGHQGNYDQAVKLREASLRIFREIHQEEMSVQILGQLGYFAFLGSEYDKALAYCEESLRIARESDSQRALLDTHLALGELALTRHNFELTRREFDEALSTATKYSLPATNRVYALEALARLAIAESDHERAAVLLGAAESIHERIPFLLFPRAKENWQKSLIAASAELSMADFHAACAEGRALADKGEQHVLAYAVGRKDDAGVAPPAEPADSLL